MSFLPGNLKLFRNGFGLTQEQLAKALCVEPVTIAFYETGKRKPSINQLMKLAEIYGVSLDFLILNQNCNYPRNLKLLKLAKILDNEALSEARNNVEGMIKTLWSKKLDAEGFLRQDSREINLSLSFHKNLKDLRYFNKLTQPKLASFIDVSRTLLNQYETKTFPSIERLIELSKIFDLSMHAMVSGEKLNFDFEDRFFGKTILSADQHLTIEEHKTLVNLLKATIDNKKQSEAALSNKNLIPT